MAAPCAPVRGSRVTGSTEPLAALTLGRPTCWCMGGEGRRVTRLVVAPEPALTVDGEPTVGRRASARGGPLVAESLGRLARACHAIGQHHGLAAALGLAAEVLLFFGRQGLVGLPFLLALVGRQLA